MFSVARGLLLVGTGAMLASACGGSEPLVAPTEQGNTYFGAQPLYAVLEPGGDGEWTFSTIGLDPSPGDSGFPVRLNDLSPAFDIRMAECEARPYRDTDRCSLLNPFRKKDVGVLDKIISGGISATTGGTLSGINTSYTTEFDEATFNSAVDAALINTGLELHRLALIEGLERYDARAQAYRAELEKLRRDYSRRYERSIRTSIRFEPKIVGLRDYYSADMAFAELVSIVPNELTGDAGGSEGVAPQILPCPAASCMAELTAAQQTLDKQHATNLARLESSLQQHTSSYRVQCSAGEHAGYHFQLICPERVELSGADVQVLPLTVIIHSRDFEQLYPEFDAVDEQLAIETDGNTLVLRNLTGSFVEVQSVSLYYNSQISTVSDLSNELDLAPRATARYPLSRFSSNAIDTEAFHARMTPDKARRTRLDFGVAVKYSVRDRDTFATLYDQRSYNVHCVIENRLRPGSCRPAGDTDQAAGAESLAGDEPAVPAENDEIGANLLDVPGEGGLTR